VVALRRTVAASGVAELVRAWEGEQLRVSLGELRALLVRIDARADASAQGPEHLLVGVIPQAADCFQVRQAGAGLEEVLTGGGTAVHAGVLTGMGGVGKTQLAAAYARRVWESGEVDVVVWVTASSRPGVVAVYADAAFRLGVAAEGDDPSAAADRFLEWAQSASSSCLVVLDDIQDPADVRGLWPPTARGNRILATTRCRDAALTGRVRRLLDVAPFAHTEARAYLVAKLAVYGRTDRTEQIDGLAADLGFLPLALAQAAAYLIDADLDRAAYRDRLADRRQRLGEVVPEEASLPDDHRQVVAAAWSLSIDRADRVRPMGLARPLLQLASVLDPNGMPAAVFTGPPTQAYVAFHHPAARATPDEPVRGPDAADIRDGLRVLHRFSLITHAPNAPGREVRVHQLIQRVTRETLTPDQLIRTAHTAADDLEAVWPDTERDQLGVVFRANTAALHDTTDTALLQWNGGAHPVLFHAATSLGETGHATAAVAEYSRLHQIAAMLGTDHSDTLRVRFNLARWQGVAGDAVGALAAYEELLADRLRLQGPDHPLTLTARRSVAWWRGEAGDPTGAAAATEDLIGDQLRVLGPDHPHVRTTRSQLRHWREQARLA
jgi:hypothetical protein